MLFSSNILPYLVVATFALSSVRGDVVQHICCDRAESCNLFFNPTPPPPGEEDPPEFSCQYYYADPFPNTVAEIQDLCLDKTGMTTTCLDSDLMDGDTIDVDTWCCEDCPAPDATEEERDDVLGGCVSYSARGPLARVEDACQFFTRNTDFNAYFSTGDGTNAGDETCLVVAAAFGGSDPHFKTWAGEWYDYHGMCDLVMLDMPDFGNMQGLTVHVRTKLRYDYSYIESAAIRIGDDVFQLSSYGDYALNGVSQAKLPATVGDYPIRQVKTNNEKETHFEIALSNRKSIELSTWKDLVNVRIPPLDHKELRTSKGLFGKFPSGTLVGRDGTTIFTDHNEFGQEWQVLETEPKLFGVVDHFPQHPHHQCVLPDPTKDSRQRRLGETINRETAAKACSHWRTDIQELCVKDVLATGDIEIAQSNHQMMV